MIAIMSPCPLLHAFFQAGVALRLTAGESLFLRDRPVDYVYWLVSGGVVLSRDGEDGARLVLETARRPGWLAEASAFADRYHCDATAAGAAQLLRRPKAELLATLSEDPRLAVAALANVCRDLRAARTRVEILAQKTVSARFDLWCETFGPKSEALPWRAVADEIAVSPEALYRERARRRR